MRNSCSLHLLRRHVVRYAGAMQPQPQNVWAIANGKGGVGKTTLAATIGQLAAADGRGC